ncbi:DUF4132 domain-containing protein [Chitinophaga sp. Hz27]|uniref:DUF4132 domain-containing protein n=1 Tax=Chitinophaga sp. Hz27 TaxID=3347169 RepID=UPI0035DEF713
MRTMYDFPLPEGEEWEDLFTLFFSLDNHKKRPDNAWYDQVAAVLDKIGHQTYLDLTVNWLTEKMATIERNAKKLDDYWLRERMEKIMRNQNPGWVSVVLTEDYMYTKENPLYTRDGYYYFYTLGGRIIRGALHTNMVLKNEVLFNVMDQVVRVSPELYIDVLEIYASMGPAFAVPRLMALRDAIKHKTYKKAIDTAISKFGGKNNKSGAEAIKEQFIPEMGFNHRHQLMVVEGNYAMGIDLIKSGVAEIGLFEKGMPVAKIPAPIKKTLSAQITSIKKQHKEIKAQYTLQKNRLEEIYRHDRSWKYEEWEPYYIVHPFAGALGKQLIWEFVNGTQSGSAVYSQGGFVNSRGETLDWIEDPNTTVKLWHPVTASSEVVSSWRNYCMKHQLQQPFRQAFREVYRPNENNDKIADHFEGHVVKQKQYNALCKMRGWSCGDFSHEDSTIKLPAYNLGAYFQIADQWRDEYSSSGGYLQVTGMAYFKNKRKDLKISEVPAVAFSEVMRDLDMIVSVSTIGNEYTPVNEVIDKARTYYETYTKRSLSPMGIVRRDILELLLPQTAFGSRCKIVEQYLHVQGELAAYKIHIGSGEVWNTKSDRYIHIEPKVSVKNANLFLPDEGDILLTVILSKANLLAEDNLIADEYLLSRIKETWKS